MIKKRMERLSDGDDSGSYHEVIRQNCAMKGGGEPHNWAQVRTMSPWILLSVEIGNNAQ